MNWFQIVSLCEESQACLHVFFAKLCCELISNCIFMWGITRQTSVCFSAGWLWIDFKLYLYVRNHKFLMLFKHFMVVVNWFQIVSLCEESQVPVKNKSTKSRCELISNCIFMWGITSRVCYIYMVRWLWIDFKLYIYVRNHKMSFRVWEYSYVVNWFQIVYLCEESQVLFVLGKKTACCELISNCIFMWGITR